MQQRFRVPRAIAGVSFFTLAIVMMGASVRVASAEVTCSAVPLDVVDGCKLAGRARFMIHDDPDPLKPIKDKLKASWLRVAEPVSNAEMGNPLVDTEYALCLYDGIAGTPVLRRDIQIPAGLGLWTNTGDSGFAFKETGRIYDGVRTLRVKGSDKVGSALVKIVAGGQNLMPPGPIAPLEYFDQDPSVIVNIVNSVGTCWRMELDPLSNSKHTEKDYKSGY